MQYKTVNSSDYPQSTQELQGKLLINIDVVESTTTDDDGNESTSYNYTQIIAETGSDADKITLEYRAEIAQEYLDSTDYLFTVDKYSQLNDDTKVELEAKRESAREDIRALIDTPVEDNNITTEENS